MAIDLSLLTQERLKELLKYNAHTGVFTNRVTRSSRAIKGDVAGCLKPSGYRIITIDGALHRAHRLVFLFIGGKLPKDQTDHINGDRDDNRLSNLRCVSSTENSKNASRSHRNISGTIGVRWRKDRCKWIATIAINGKATFIGSFNDMESAIAARKKANVKYGYHRNHGKPQSHSSLE